MTHNVSGTVVLKNGKDGSIRRFHPWIFSGAIQSLEGSVVDGDWVRVADGKGQTLGFGHYQKGTISVRIISFSDDLTPENIWLQKIRASHRLRLQSGVISRDTDSFRLVHGEGDGLPGLIIDIYNGVAVMQAHTVGMHRDREAIAHSAKVVLGDSLSSVYYKSQNTLPGKATNEYLLGMATAPHLITEHGIKFYVDWVEGQKTGFFLDQRENRKLLGEISREKKY